MLFCPVSPVYFLQSRTTRKAKELCLNCLEEGRNSHNSETINYSIRSLFLWLTVQFFRKSSVLHNFFFYFSPCLKNIMYFLKKSVSIGFILSEFTSYPQVQLHIIYVSVQKWQKLSYLCIINNLINKGRKTDVFPDCCHIKGRMSFACL